MNYGQFEGGPKHNHQFEGLFKLSETQSKWGTDGLSPLRICSQYMDLTLKIDKKCRASIGCVALGTQ